MKNLISGVVACVAVLSLTPVSAAPSARVFSTIKVVGNERFRDGDILATSGLSAGVSLGEEDLRAGVDALMFTGEFDDVRITSSGDVLTIYVDEQAQQEGRLVFGAGYDSEDGAYASVGFVLKDVIRNGSSLTADLSYSERYVTFDADYFQPDVFGERVGFGVAARFEAFDRESALFAYSSYKVSPYISYELEGGDVASVRLSHARTKIKDVDANASAILQADAGAQTTNAIGLRYLHGKVDQSSERASWSAMFDAEIAGLGGDANYSRGELRLNGFVPLGGGFALRSTLEAGIIRGNSGYDPRITDRFGLGGAALRGFEQFTVGAKDDAGGVVTNLGGNKFYAFRTDFLVPIFKPETGVETFAFADVGRVWGLETSVAPSGTLSDVGDTRTSAGVGASYQTGFGRFEAYWSMTQGKTALDKSQAVGLTFRSDF